MTENQKQFKAAVDAAEAIRTSAAAKGMPLNEEESKAFNAHIANATRLRGLVEQDAALDGLKSWGQESQGSAALAGGFMGEAVVNGEGLIPGVTDAYENVYDAKGAKIGVRRTGEMIVNESKAVPDEYKSLGEAKIKHLKSGAYKDAYNLYLRSTALGRPLKDSHPAMKVLEPGIDNAGGFWIPVDQRVELIKKEATVPGVSNDVNTYTVGSDLVRWPKVVYTTDDLYSSGVLPSWSAAAPSSDASEATNPIAGMEEINIHLLTAVVILARTQVEDNMFDLLGYISQVLGENIPLFKNNAYINGDGVGKPTGYLNHTNATVAHASGGMQVLSGVANVLSWGTEATLSSDVNGVLGTEASLPPQYENGAKWYGKKQTFANLRGLVDSQGRPLWNQYDGFAPYVNGYPGTLIGYPIVKDQFLEAVGDGKRPLTFGQMRAYHAPTRVGFSVEVFREVQALKDRVVIYARERVGGKLIEDYRIKLLKSDNA